MPLHDASVGSCLNITSRFVRENTLFQRRKFLVPKDGKMTEKKKEPLFPAIDADAEQEPTAIESLCMACYEQGTTRLLLTRIPYFKDVILSSFECLHCGHSNNEIQPGTVIQDQGCKITLKVENTKDLNRQVVKTNSALFTIPELDFESPAFSQKGELSTVEGFLLRACTGLEQEQPVRRITAPEVAAKIDEIVAKLNKCQTGEMQFTFVLDDSAGNSFIENPYAPKEDPNLTMTHYTRSKEQDEMLGIQASAEQSSDEPKDEQSGEGDEETPATIVGHEEVLNFDTNCSSCSAPAVTHMKAVAIPHFKEVIIMATNCDACGHRSSEVKSGSGIEPKGTRIDLRITDPTDLNRDVLKSETCGVKVPSLNFELESFSLGGRFTTLEGLLTNIKEKLQSINPFGLGDSPALSATKMKEFLDKLDKIISGKRLDVHILMDDPAGNSYMQNLYAPDDDPELHIEHYERTKEQNDDLGISDMNTEDYMKGS